MPNRAGDRPTRSIAQPIGLVAIVAVLACAAGAGVFEAGARTSSESEERITYRPVQTPKDGYISSETCRACHPSQYETWRASYHRTMTQAATPASVRADFSSATVAGAYGRSMILDRRGSGFWAEFDDPDWRGDADRAPRISRQIVMTTGSHSQQVYWYRTDRGRLLGQLPAMYLLADRRWIPRRAAFLRPDGRPASETGRWNAVCIDCHATRGEPGFEAPVESRSVAEQLPNTRVAEFGIACEACHGPSREHATANRNPLRRYELHLTGAADATTVHTRRLSTRISSDVCGQCHSVWSFSTQAAKAQASATGLVYRPGAALAASRFVAQPSAQMNTPILKTILSQYPGFVRDSFWSDGMIRVSGREYNGLIDSPCFKDADDDNRRMSCFSCHSMHNTPGDSRSTAEWADTHQLSGGMRGNDACLQCHNRLGTNVTAHTKHRADSAGTLCYNCHMPYTSYGLLKALRSHQISSPTVAASVETGRPNACNLCHLDKTLEWTSEQLRRMYGTSSPALGDDERTVAASLLWLMRGDAGQRALAAWSLGWPPAQSVSGTNWMAPYLALLVDDPYAAVRYIAYRSLRSVPGFENFQYDFMAPSSRRAADGVRAMDLWRRVGSGRLTDRALLFDAGGALRKDEWTRIVGQRDDRPINLAE